VKRPHPPDQVVSALTTYFGVCGRFASAAAVTDAVRMLEWVDECLARAGRERTGDLVETPTWAGSEP
jgi:hypothetical protein